MNLLFYKIATLTTALKLGCIGFVSIMQVYFRQDEIRVEVRDLC
jgi:hypothetical protein